MPEEFDAGQAVGSEQAPAEQAQAPAQETPPPVDPLLEARDKSWNPQAWPLKVKGQQFYPENPGQLITWAQMGRDYNQNQEALKRQQSELDAQAQKYGSLSKFHDTLQSDSNFNQAFRTWAQNYENGVYPTYGQGESNYSNEAPEVSELRRQNLQLQQSIEGLEGKLSSLFDRDADAKLQQEIDQLKASDPKTNWDEMVDVGNGRQVPLWQRVLHHGNDRMKQGLSVDEMNWLFRRPQIEAQMKASILSQQAKQTQARSRQGIVDSGQAVPPPQKPAFDPSKADWSEVTKQALEHMGG
jgi:hypothetical protein